MRENELSTKIIGLCIGIHKILGPGLLESVYEECLCHELGMKKLKFKRQQGIPLVYKSIKMSIGFRSDIIVEDKVIIEIKSVENIINLHKAQVLTYLKITNLKLGLLINFNETILKDGITRIVNNL